MAVKPELTDTHGEKVRARVGRLVPGLEKVRTAKVYRFEGLSPDQARFLARQLLAEPIFQIYAVNAPLHTDARRRVEVAYKPGVTNPEADALMKIARDLGLTGLVAADSSREYAFYGEFGEGDWGPIISDLLNDAVEYTVDEPPETLLIDGPERPAEIIPIRDMNDEELLALSKDRLYLNRDEMRLIRDYFRGKGREATDCEIEVLAQTWSEHCVHKTFKARVIVDGREKKPFLTRLQEAAAAIDHPLVLSAFVDNSGVMEFYDGWAICGKVETHNSPSAIEPYGGAATGSGGVFRDIMGTGRGAKVIAGTDMFCLGPPDLPAEAVPPGCLHPRYLLRRVVDGVRDYGNQMGVPTINGSLHFHPDFRAKPTVIVGAYGLLPADKAQKGTPQPGDLVVALGGRTGRDGLHGATFSSAAMTDRTVAVNAQAVQIGHPIAEKRVHDVVLKARDENLIRAITDCGAGGFASAVGEMGGETGVRIALDRAPLKYGGLAPWEILLSESQERMVLAVRPDRYDRLTELCARFNVEAAVLGTFTDDRHFRATFDGREVLNLDMDFLHRGLPQREMHAAWAPRTYPEPPPSPVGDWPAMLKKVLSHLNVCSKEPIARLYDHGVQGGNALPPFGGVDGGGPNDAAVITPLPGKPHAVVIGHGLNPVLNRIDPYWGSIWAATEAAANVVAAGADPREIMLIDNFIWPVPDPEMMGALDRAVDGCVDFSLQAGMPFISGKDSLSSTYRTGDGMLIQIPPVVCISAFGRVPDVRRTVSADLKAVGNRLLLLGGRNLDQMGGSVYFDVRGYTGHKVPRVRVRTVRRVFSALHRATAAGHILACHDISEGGLAAALTEMCLGGGVGAEIDVPADVTPAEFLFNETAGCFVIELADGADAGELFADVPCRKIGRVVSPRLFTAFYNHRRLFSVPLADLGGSWQGPMKGVFGV